jgi:quinol monooxygenase YgiN
VYSEDKEGKDMIIVSAVLEAQVGKESDMERALLDFIPKVQAEEGTIAYVLHRSKGNPAKFMVYEKYVDEAALGYHGSTEYFKELFDTVGPMLAGAPSIEIYEELAAKE